MKLCRWLRWSPRPSAARPLPHARPCLEALEDRVVPATLPTFTAFTNIQTHYTALTQDETLTVHVTAPFTPVSQGQVVFTDLGFFSRPTPVDSNGFATATVRIP